MSYLLLGEALAEPSARPLPEPAGTRSPSPGVLPCRPPRSSYGALVRAVTRSLFVRGFKWCYHGFSRDSEKGAILGDRRIYFGC